jgi:hypothetical protein
MHSKVPCVRRAVLKTSNILSLNNLLLDYIVYMQREMGNKIDAEVNMFHYPVMPDEL